MRASSSRSAASPYSLPLSARPMAWTAGPSIPSARSTTATLSRPGFAPARPSAAAVSCAIPSARSPESPDFASIVLSERRSPLSSARSAATSDGDFGDAVAVAYAPGAKCTWGSTAGPAPRVESGSAAASSMSEAPNQPPMPGRDTDRVVSTTASGPSRSRAARCGSTTFRPRKSWGLMFDSFTSRYRELLDRQPLDDAQRHGGVDLAERSDDDVGKLSLEDCAHVAAQIGRGDDAGSCRGAGLGYGFLGVRGQPSQNLGIERAARPGRNVAQRPAEDFFEARVERQRRDAPVGAPEA